MTIRVLLVEDDIRFAEAIIDFLEFKNFIVDFSSNGEQAYSLIQKNNYDVIVCDVNMPKVNGLDFCQQLRNEGKDTPLIFASSNIEVDDKLLGFEKGADDYLTKPFNLKELAARIEVLSKRKSGSSNKVIIKELDMVVDLKDRKIQRKSKPVQLPPSSWKLLEKLVRAFPEPVSKSDLEFAIWGEESPDSNSLKVHIHTLRKLVDKPFNFNVIQTVSGFGLKLGIKD